MNKLHRTTLVTALAALAASFAAQASDYNAAFCAQVAGTLNIHWQAVAGPFAPCISIETTNGTLAQAATGHVTMEGITVSDFNCTYPTAYRLDLLGDGTTMHAVTQSLFPGEPVVPMTLVRGPGEQCFVGRWSFGADVYVGHIWAPPFRTFNVPVLGDATLAALAVTLAALGALALRRHRRPRS
jgi:hypothetical protein